MANGLQIDISSEVIESMIDANLFRMCPLRFQITQKIAQWTFKYLLSLNLKSSLAICQTHQKLDFIIERNFLEELSLSCSFEPSQDFCFHVFASRPKFQEGSPSAMMALWSFCIACSWTYKQPFASKSTWLARRLQSGQNQKLFSQIFFFGKFFLVIVQEMWKNLFKTCEYSRLSIHQ